MGIGEQRAETPVSTLRTSHLVQSQDGRGRDRVASAHDMYSRRLGEMVIVVQYEAINHKYASPPSTFMTAACGRWESAGARSRGKRKSGRIDFPVPPFRHASAARLRGSRTEETEVSQPFLLTGPRSTSTTPSSSPAIRTRRIHPPSRCGRRRVHRGSGRIAPCGSFRICIMPSVPCIIAWKDDDMIPSGSQRQSER